MNKKIASFYLLIAFLGMSKYINIWSSEVTEGIVGGGFLGAAIGGAAGGGRGAAIGGAVGASVGAVTGAAVRESRKRRYYEYEDSEMLYDQNEELRNENNQLITEHKELVQLNERYKWMLDQCKKGEIRYKEQSEGLTFENDTNYSRFTRWRDKTRIRRQNKQLASINSKLRKKINRLNKKNRSLKKRLRTCEEKKIIQLDTNWY